MAKASGISVSSVQRVWCAFGLQPPRTPDGDVQALDRPNFVAKVRGVTEFVAFSTERLGNNIVLEERVPVDRLDQFERTERVGGGLRDELNRCRCRPREFRWTFSSALRQAALPPPWAQFFEQP